MGINWLQAAITVLFAVFIFAGWRKGFLRIIISLTGTIVIIIAVAIISPKVSRYVIENTTVYEQTQKKVTNTFIDKLNSSGEDSYEEKGKNKTVSADEAVSLEESKDDSLFEDLNLPDILKNDLIEKTASEMYRALLEVVIKEYISGYVAKLIINAGSFVAVYAVLSIVLRIILKSSDIITGIPVIKGFNKMLGALAGAAQALIIVWIFFFVVIMLFGETAGSRLLEEVQASVFLRYLFNHNFLFRFIS